MSRRALLAAWCATLFLHGCHVAHSQPGAAPPTPGAAASYVLIFDADHPGTIDVEATLPEGGDQLQLSQQADAPGEGWGDFIHNLEAWDRHGNLLDVTPAGPARWRTSAPPGEPVRLRYRFVSAHEAEQWGNLGAFARAYELANAVFLAGRAIFLTAAAAPDAPARIRLRLPRRWTAATPFEPVPGAPNSYSAPSTASLWRNGMIAGRLYERRVGAGALDIRIATPVETRETADLFAGALGDILSGYAAVMGVTPSGRLTIIASVGPWADGGEAFDQTISMMTRAPPSAATSGRWATLLAHEAFHFWSGTSERATHAIVPAAPDDVQWFIEGFTDYMAKVAVRRLRLISDDAFLAHIATAYDRYSAVAGSMSLRAAGANKGLNGRLIYSGGFLAALALDLELRAAGQPGLPAFMRRVQSEFGGNGRRYGYADLRRIALDMLGIERGTAFFDSYINGTAVIPTEAYLQRIGLTAHTRESGSVVERTAPTRAQIELFDSIISQGLVR